MRRPAQVMRRPARVLSPVADFLRTEAAGGVVLLAATVAALGWANSPWAGGSDGFWHTT